MRRKVLQGVANELCQMAGGSRLTEDYEQLAELPDGTLSFDLVKSIVLHSSGIQPGLKITSELSEWLKARLRGENINAAMVRADLEVRYTTDRIRTDRRKLVSFDLECRSVVRTDEAAYEGASVKSHVYHQRLGA